MTDELKTLHTPFSTPNSSPKTRRAIAPLTPEQEDLKRRIAEHKKNYSLFSNDINNAKTGKLSKLALLEKFSLMYESVYQLINDYNNFCYSSPESAFDMNLEFVNKSYTAIKNLVGEKKSSSDENLSPNETASILGKCQTLENTFPKLHPNLGRRPNGVDGLRPLRKSIEDVISMAYNIKVDNKTFFIIEEMRSYLMSTMYSKKCNEEANVDQSKPTSRSSIKVF